MGPEAKPALVHVPGPLRQYTGGASTIEIAPGTVSEVLARLDVLHPGIAARVLDDQGRVRQHVNLFLNEESVKGKDIRRLAVNAGDRLQILPSVSGGGA